MALPLRRPRDEVLVAMNDTKRPVSAPEQMWIVLSANAERHIIEKEPLGGIQQWAAGQKGITVIEYAFKAVVYHSPAAVPKK